MKTDRRLALASILFIAGILVAVYAIGPNEGHAVLNIVLFAALMIFHFAIGFLARNWLAMLLPPIAVLLSVPAGTPNTTAYEPLPIWFGMLFVIEPLGLAALALGVAVAKLTQRRRHNRFRPISA